MDYPTVFDVIVIGGGHAGVEAAHVSARMGSKTLLLTQNIETLGQMSCNPAIGGIGKGHLVKEVDALGGLMGRAIDKAGIHFKTLNESKGPAVRASRAQADRALYKNAIREFVEHQPNLTLFQQPVEDLIVDNDKVTGVITQMGLKFFAGAVVLTVGTFLGGVIHIGLQNSQGGRAGCPPSNALSKRLRAMPFEVGRLKTGTPPRIDGRTIDFSSLDAQPGLAVPRRFSFVPTSEPFAKQINCYITHTNSKTHDIIRANLERSPMFAGEIEGTGPRYCPSIEDKVVRFESREAHQVFIEPEGLNTTEVYPNGISTSLPFDVQLDYVRSIKGFEQAHISRPGYAIEYDYFDPRGLNDTLETKPIQNLFFAGQINGTTGYEEAAAQGIVAGINAARKADGKSTWAPKRDNAYIGVLIDDLITLGTKEPYRMFTSRAEHRLLLREDNADLRLTELGRELGAVTDEQWQAFTAKKNNIDALMTRVKREVVQPDSEVATAASAYLDKPLSKVYAVYDLLRRPEIHFEQLKDALHLCDVNADVMEQVSIQAKYHGYIERQKAEISKREKQEHTELPVNLKFKSIKGLSNEVVQKLETHKPQTIGQASRISGVTPAAISLLLVHLKKQSYQLEKQ